ncbi:IS21 family transposase [Jonesiaceae bacterium BS-20]|uniref:IS21 family transposase n=1 Tax=Jonesiaceae bacterium BS-20 TaxID=3120821 RepID=A0AAU7DUH3_9MICO
MKSDGEIMEILEAYDLTQSFRSAAVLAGCSHHTVAKHVEARAAGRPIAQLAVREKITDDFLPHIEGWIDSSSGTIRSDVVHGKLIGLGYTGSERTTRRVVKQVRLAWQFGHTRVHRPWITEPGLWLQYDFGDGPVIDGVKTVLFVAWLAWSRFRIVIALRDKTAPSVFGALDRSFRILGGAPTYVLTDNEKTVTVSHIAGVPVRNLQTVDFARYYGVTVLTCAPADPATKGGVEASVKLAKADLVPKSTNLREEYDSFEELEAACASFMDRVNTREHRGTKRLPASMLNEEVLRLHRVPDDPHLVSFGVPRAVPANTPMVTFNHGQYSVPSYLLGQKVLVRQHGTGPSEQVIIMHLGPDGVREVARHHSTSPGSPAINNDHFPEHVDKIPGHYTLRPSSASELEFLAIGVGAGTWLREACAVGTKRITQKMAEAVALSKIAGVDAVDHALGTAAVHGRFAHDDLASILYSTRPNPITHSANEDVSLTQGTSSWAAITSTYPVGKEKQ